MKAILVAVLLACALGCAKKKIVNDCPACPSCPVCESVRRGG